MHEEEHTKYELAMAALQSTVIALASRVAALTESSIADKPEPTYISQEEFDSLQEGDQFILRKDLTADWEGFPYATDAMEIEAKSGTIITVADGRTNDGYIVGVNTCFQYSREMIAEVVCQGKEDTQQRTSEEELPYDCPAPLFASIYVDMDNWMFLYEKGVKWKATNDGWKLRKAVVVDDEGEVMSITGAIWLPIHRWRKATPEERERYYQLTKSFSE